MMTTIAIATSLHLPHSDEDEELLLAALRARGVTVEMAAWDDERVDWSRFALTVVRSTWSYYAKLDAFLAWSRSVPRLYNSAATIAWNCDKHYLQRFPNAIATRFVARGSREELAHVANGWQRAVVKPRVSAGSFETYRFDVGAASGELQRCAAERDVLVQPYVRSVEDYGERSLIWIDGELTHAVRKSARFASEEESVTPMPIADDERAYAFEVLSHVNEPLLYARVDLARDDDGRPMLMELELIEPSLFLRHAAAGLERLCDAIVRRA